MYFIYFQAVVNKWEVIDRKVFKWAIPYIINVLCMATSPFTELVFNYDSSGYSRGILINFISGISLLYIAAPVIIVIKNKEQKLYKSPIECTDIYNQRATKDIKIPFDCLRYHQNEYLMDKIIERKRYCI